MSPVTAHMRCDGAVAVLATHVVHLARYSDRAFANPGLKFDRTMALQTLTAMEEEIANCRSALVSTQSMGVAA